MSVIGKLIKFVGKFIKFVGWSALVVFGLWGYILCLVITTEAAGFWGIAAFIFLTPVTFVVAPLYAGFACHNWFPLILNYGGGSIAIALIGAGSLLDKNVSTPEKSRPLDYGARKRKSPKVWSKKMKSLIVSLFKSKKAGIVFILIGAFIPSISYPFVEQKNLAYSLPVFLRKEEFSIISG